MKRLCFALVASLFTVEAPAPVRSPFPDSAPQHGTLAERMAAILRWIEIYNAGDTAVNLLDWSMTDTEGKPQQVALPATICLRRISRGVWPRTKIGRARREVAHQLQTGWGAGSSLAWWTRWHTRASQFAPAYPPQ